MGQRAPDFVGRVHSWGPRWACPRQGRARTELRALDSSSGSAADLRQAPCPTPATSEGASVCPRLRQRPPKPSLEDPGGQVRGSTYRRISCLVKNVKSWKGENKTGGGQRAAGPAACSRLRFRAQASKQAPRGPGVPRTWYSASSSLDRRLPELPIAAPRAPLHQLVSGRRQLSHFRPRAASPPHPRGNRS